MSFRPREADYFVVIANEVKQSSIIYNNYFSSGLLRYCTPRNDGVREGAKRSYLVIPSVVEESPRHRVKVLNN